MHCLRDCTVYTYTLYVHVHTVYTCIAFGIEYCQHTVSVLVCMYYILLLCSVADDSGLSDEDSPVSSNTSVDSDKT